MPLPSVAAPQRNVSLPFLREPEKPGGVVGACTSGGGPDGVVFSITTPARTSAALFPTESDAVARRS